MTPALYFLRSSEQKIATDIIHFAYRLDEVSKTIEDVKELDMYHKFYGLTDKDLGLYALVNHKIAGAIWMRLLKKEDNSNAFVDEETPVLTIGVKPEFRNKGVGSAMLNQLLLEAGSLYKQISISLLDDERTIKYFEKFGFTKIEDSGGKSPVDNKDIISMIKSIPKEAVVRPSDGYDPKKWMD
ncbi:MAG: GNAT family N-acetyltransferase [Sulfurimonas sp.]|nr:GNAT family N-acetyltransferase [Sulfurimonas sp.]